MRARDIVPLWLPMAGTWLMMALEAPFLAAVLARSERPAVHLAAFGVCYAVAVLAEAPVIMLLAASTTLVRGADSYRRLLRFAMILCVLTSGALLALVTTPAWSLLAREGLGLPPEVVAASRGGLLLLVPWPAAIGYRRFRQGILIRAGRTRLVAYGTALRLLAMASAALLASRAGIVGVRIGAGALTAGVLAEVLAAHGMSRKAVRALRQEPETRPLSYAEIGSFYAPLAATSVLSLAVHPVVSAFLGRARDPLESLAVLPVVNSLTFLFRSAGLSFQEVAIALIDRQPRPLPTVRRFAIALGVSASVGMALIVFTPLSHLWFARLSGLDAALASFATTPARILAVIPALSVLLALQRAWLVSARTTGPLTAATLVEVAGIVLTLALATRLAGWNGATAAAFAFVAGRIAANLYLLPGCSRALAKL